MKKNSFWLKIIAVLIIQALLLTQADFAVAALYHSQEHFQEIVLKVQKISDRHTSFVSGIVSVQLASAGIKFPYLNLKTVFLLLKGFSTNITGFLNAEEMRQVNKQIYKAYDCIVNDRVEFADVRTACYYNLDKKVNLFLICKTEEATGPPTDTIKVACDVYNRTVKM
ncbi:MAG: hypothetical protein KKA52_00390 [Candidatus Omnitrophica bacterium]|nr:hypothetical protein [Candidatus Omnitrophota bacterium]